MKTLLAAVLCLGCAASALAQHAVPVPQNENKTTPIKRTAYDDCMGKIKTPRDIERMQLHLLRNEDKAFVGDELAGMLTCNAVVSRVPDPCASLKGLGMATGLADKNFEALEAAQCRKLVRFARFYQEALHASSQQRSYPACVQYFRGVPLIDARPGFDSVCAKMALMIQNKQDDFCTPAMDPFVKDKARWPAVCKIVGDLYVRGDGSNCSFFPDPRDCSAMAALVPSFQSGRSDMCGNNLAGGICHAFTPGADKSIPRCKLPWLTLSRDYCRALVASGAFRNPVKGGEKQGAVESGPPEGEQQAPDETAPSEEN